MSQYLVLNQANQVLGGPFTSPKEVREFAVTQGEGEYLSATLSKSTIKVRPPKRQASLVVEVSTNGETEE